MMGIVFGLSRLSGLIEHKLNLALPYQLDKSGILEKCIR